MPTPTIHYNSTHPKLPYTLIPRTLCLITHHHSILLIKGSPTKPTWPGLYNGIGGHVERGETIEEAAFREIQEETSLTAIADLRLRGTIAIDTGEATGVLLFIFTATSHTTTVHASSEGTLAWVPMYAISSMPCVEDLPDLIARIADMQPTDPPFHLRYRPAQ